MDEHGPLAIVFDIDGTLVTDDGPSDVATVRPHAVDILKWCKARGHRVALFSAAGSGRVACMKTALCTGSTGEAHACDLFCQRVFDFTWTANKLSALEHPKIGQWADECGNRCGWCGYRACDRCTGCDGRASGYCPCRQVKKLQKVWSNQPRRRLGYTKERTVILENTPQQCFLNYGNAFYVRTFEMSSNCEEDNDLLAFQHLMERLESVADVRKFRKCACAAPAVGFHDCRAQTWWSEYRQPHSATE